MPVHVGVEWSTAFAMGRCPSVAVSMAVAYSICIPMLDVTPDSCCRDAETHMGGNDSCPRT